ncbi:MAG: type II toxin-antitoxin system RelE/ParE family toxin [Anaerolineales bacterium]|nr:type II toxin-antitoxin system RelE/ParE family toxin [Anaerolineales bacterium]
MPKKTKRIIITPGAVSGLERCRLFLAGKNPRAARRAADTIKKAFAMLGDHPEIGRPYAQETGLRELLIAFGDSGYVALYRHETVEDAVVIVAFRHQKEDGYG